MSLLKNEIKIVGFIDKGTGAHQSNLVYSTDGIAPCVCAMFSIKQPPTMILEVEDDDTILST